MAQFDVDAMIERYARRAQSVKERPLPPVAGADRKKFIDQAEADFTDFLLISKSCWSVAAGNLILTIPLSSE
jgi:hypothetical protein